MNEKTVIPLLPRYFSHRETIFATSGKLTASTFLYSTGVAGLRITNSCGEIEVLPFQGQQIWRASFYDRELTMRSMFDEPNPTTDYLKAYLLKGNNITIPAYVKDVVSGQNNSNNTAYNVSFNSSLTS